MKTLKNIFLLVFLFVGIQAAAQLQGTDGFIKGSYIEAGFQANGCYGSRAAAPAGYHPQSSTNLLGFIADPNKTGWTDYYGDFFVPGTPYEGFAVAVVKDGTTTTYHNSGSGYNDAFTHDVSNPGLVEISLKSMEWRGIAGGNVEVTNRQTIDDEKLLIHHEVVVKNVSSSTVTVYVGRCVDPDNSQVKKGKYETTNTIESQGNGTPGKPAWVSATAVPGQDNSCVSYYSENPNARVGIATYTGSFGSLMTNLVTSWEGTNLNALYAERSKTENSDSEMGIFFKEVDILPNTSRTIEFDIRLDQPPVVRFVNPVSSSDLKKKEGETFTFNLEREYQLDKEVVATIKLDKVTSAITNADFVGVPSLPHEITVVFPPNVTTGSFTVEAAYDALIEGDETFQVRIDRVTSDLGGFAVAPISLNATIVDIPIPTATLSFSCIAVNEGDNCTLTVTLNTAPVTGVGAATFDLTFTGTATFGVGNDYTIGNPLTNISYPGSGNTYHVTIPVGQTTATITLAALSDKLLEDDETVAATLSNAVNGLISSSGGTASITIKDQTDGEIVVVKQTPTTGDASEPDKHGSFRIKYKDDDVTRVKATKVLYTITGASPSSNYTVRPTPVGEATIPAYSNSVDVFIDVIDNNIVEGARNIEIEISNPTPL